LIIGAATAGLPAKAANAVIPKPAPMLRRASRRDKGAAIRCLILVHVVKLVGAQQGLCEPLPNRDALRRVAPGSLKELQPALDLIGLRRPIVEQAVSHRNLGRIL